MDDFIFFEGRFGLSFTKATLMRIYLNYFYCINAFFCVCCIHWNQYLPLFLYSNN